tara:strand:- start:86 stop:886 length:801 start_codon:yes stop_codon:yes gene_type:complete
MEKSNSSFSEVLKRAQKNGYAESDPKSDIEGIDSAHKLSLLSTICFGASINFKNVIFKGISDIQLEDIKNANNLGYKVKLISTSEIIEGKIFSIVEPTLIKKDSQLGKVDHVLNGIKIESDYLNSLFIEGEGAGGKATASSIISDLFEISKRNDSNSLGFKSSQLIDYQKFDNKNRFSSYYLRIQVKDIPGVLAKITSNLNDEGVSIETIFQIPDNSEFNKINEVPIIITTHETRDALLKRSLVKIEKLDFVVSKIAVINIDKEDN